MRQWHAPWAQVEGYLEELLLLCQRSEEYAQYVLGAMAGAVAPAALGAARENAFRSGPFNLLVRELIAYYINLARPHASFLGNQGAARV